MCIKILNIIKYVSCTHKSHRRDKKFYRHYYISVKTSNLHSELHNFHCKSLTTGAIPASMKAILFMTSYSHKETTNANRRPYLVIIVIKLYYCRSYVSLNASKRAAPGALLLSACITLVLIASAIKNNLALGTKVLLLAFRLDIVRITVRYCLIFSRLTPREEIA